MHTVGSYEISKQTNGAWANNQK